MNQITKKQFTYGALWKMLEGFSSKGITMVVSIIIARKLMPQDYGIVALTTIFLNLSDVLIEGGFGTALIRKKEIDDYDYSCVFTISFFIAVLLYSVFFLLAPLIADYYNEPQFNPVFRVLGLTVFFQALLSTRMASVNRNLQFRFLCISNIITSVLAGFVGILLAYSGLGVWAIVIQRLVYNALLSLFLCVKIKIAIRWRLKYERIKEIFSFSIGVVSASLISFCTNNIYSAVIGKRYSVTDLGYYSKGNQLPEQFSLYTFSSVSGVLLPTISKCQNDIGRMKHIVRKVVSFTAYLIFPLMVGMMLTSDELIVLLLTDKWRAAVPVMTGACIYYIGMPFMLLNSQVYYAFGNSLLKVRVEIIRLVLMSFGLLIGSFLFNCTISQLAVIGGFVMLIVAFISAIISGKMLNYSLFELFNDVWKSILCTVVMAMTILIVNHYLRFFGVSSILVSLGVKVFVGIFAYLISSIIFKVDGLGEIKTFFLGFIKR